MNCLATSLRATARRWPALRRTRRWWLRPAYEIALLAIQVLSLAWLMESEI